tara:strand:+ start:408 stop:860 length:453 start_codon:yes stop_codon:yes gene_type:complete
MSVINLISLDGNTLKDIGISGIDGLIVTNTDTTDITIDLLIGPKTLHNKTTTTGAYFILKDIPVPLGSSFVWDDNGFLSSAGDAITEIFKYQTIKSKFEICEGFTFLIRVGSGHTADVVMFRLPNVTRGGQASNSRSSIISRGGIRSSGY